MRRIMDHIVDGDTMDRQLGIDVIDEPGVGGANHEYEIRIGSEGPGICRISFQNGPIKEMGVNGVTHEALLVIAIDRLRSFQAGPYACEDNQTALEHCLGALVALQQRTIARIKRGVEGTREK